MSGVQPATKPRRKAPKSPKSPNKTNPKAEPTSTPKPKNAEMLDAQSTPKEAVKIPKSSSKTELPSTLPKSNPSANDTIPNAATKLSPSESGTIPNSPPAQATKPSGINDGIPSEAEADPKSSKGCPRAVPAKIPPKITGTVPPTAKPSSTTTPAKKTTEQSSSQITSEQSAPQTRQDPSATTKQGLQSSEAVQKARDKPEYTATKTTDVFNNTSSRSTTTSSSRHGQGLISHNSNKNNNHNQPPSVHNHKMEQSSEYKSTISARPTFNRAGVNQSSSTAGGGRTLKIVTEYGASSIASPAFSQNAASAILESREREKKEMADLNDRLASYIEKVRFLEAQNRKLAADLEALKSRWGKDTQSIRQMYEGELAEARKLIDETARAKNEVEGQIARLQADLADYRNKYEEALRLREGDKEKIEGLLSQLADAEAEIALLRRRIENLEEEVARLKRENQRLTSELSKTRSDLDQETLNRIDYQNQVQTLLEEIEFLKRVHDQEIKELQTLAARDTTAENREFFKNELALAIRDIRSEYDQITANNKTDMESWYKLKVQEVQTASARQNMEQGYQKEETRRLRSQLGDLRGKLADLEGRNMLLEKQVQELTYQLEDDQRQYEAALNDRDAQIRKMREECQALMVELQMLLDTKQTLDAEIAIYRKMLEGEENRNGLRQLVEQVVKTHSVQQNEDTDSMRVIKGETASRTSFQRSAKGNVSIAECNPDGKFIILENTNRNKEESMDDWKLKRKIDGKREVVFSLPSKFTLKPGKTVKIFARGQGGANPPDSLVMDKEDNWGQGQNVQTLLFNKDGEERASHIQRASQTTTAQ